MVAKREVRWSMKNEALMKELGMDPRRTVLFTKLPPAVRTSAQLTQVIQHALHGEAHTTQADHRRTHGAPRTAANKARTT